MAETHIHIHFGYAPEKPPQVTEEAQESPAEEATESPLAEKLEALTEAHREATAKSAAQMERYHKELRALQKVSDDHYKRMVKESRAFGQRKPAQAELLGTEEMSDEDDRDREYRLMRKYTEGHTLTPAEFDWLRRRGCVRY